MTDLLAGPDAATEAVRTAVIEAAIALFREQPLHHVALDEVAAAAGISTAELTAIHPTVDDLVIAVIRAWNQRRTAPLMPIAEGHGAVAFLRAIVLANAADPALMRLLTSAATIAATPTLPQAEQLQASWIHFHAIVQRALTQDVAVGREPATMEPARGAEQLIALYEGLQLQSMVRPHMDVVEAYDRAVTRLRDGWSRDYPPSVWEI
ncbi:TetR/AcrR family transcriptional regulator [Amnibacterium setariae]|uniref:TetR/AcrR family transcriptional regulator n=1 Tax=Amnibacterium setariae TaxID=2306585 RepID=UPI001313F0FB|nr:TetR family transcriptional regulator [Amnibacterium setariae]